MCSGAELCVMSQSAPVAGLSTQHLFQSVPRQVRSRRLHNTWMPPSAPTTCLRTWPSALRTYVGVCQDFVEFGDKERGWVGGGVRSDEGRVGGDGAPRWADGAEAAELRRLWDSQENVEEYIPGKPVSAGTSARPHGMGGRRYRRELPTRKSYGRAMATSTICTKRQTVLHMTGFEIWRPK